MDTAGEMLAVAKDHATEAVAHHIGVATIPVTATLSLTTLILALAAAIFVVPPMAAKVDFYHGHLKRKCGFLGQPPRAPILFTWAFWANVFLLLSGVWYFYNESVNAATDDTAANYYVAVESLIMLIIIFKYLWKGIVWNLYDRTWAMIIALILSVAVPLIELILIVLMGLRNVWFSMGFMIGVFLLNIPLPFWTWVIYSYFKEVPRKKKNRSESM